jgi:SAM-dependent methyltransferase
VDESHRRRALEARAAIESGALRGAALVEQIVATPLADRDAWIDEALGGALAPPPDRPDLPRGAVPYLPCGVEDILAMVRDVPVTHDDELVDLGSGLGRVVMIANLLTGARARGIEIQDHLVASARARCAALGLTGVTFVHANAADIELDGTVFFLYAPCNGDLLARVVARLEAVARRRPIVVCTVDLELADTPWLVARDRPTSSLTVYRSRAAR